MTAPKGKPVISFLDVYDNSLMVIETLVALFAKKFVKYISTGKL